MYYKLSNTASANEIEESFGIPMEFPKLYKQSTIINGLEESILPIITMEQSDKISFGIWGLMPQELDDNWQVFQNFTNTLNLNVEKIDHSDTLYAQALNSRRCIVITTGFFTSAIRDGKMCPYHVHLADHKPFGIAGVYNRLEDGFITCSILVNRIKNETEQIPHILSYKPVIFDETDRQHWLNSEYDFNELEDLISSHTRTECLSNPVSKEFYDNDMEYKNVLDGIDFDKLFKIS